MLLISSCVSPAAESHDVDLTRQAQSELFAARYQNAADLYQKIVTREPAFADGYYGLVRALLKAHRAGDAYVAAENGLKSAPHTAGALSAAGLANFRRGDVQQAEQNFLDAYKLDRKHPGALNGMALIYAMVSKFKTARALSSEAYEGAPGDPALRLAHANTLKGAEHIAELERVLAIYDPQSEEAHNLRAHIAADRAAGDRVLRRLTNSPQNARIKLFWIFDGPKRKRGLGMRVQLNGRHSVTLLLDTGASGISVSPKTAEKAGLEILTEESSEVKGIGDERPQASLRYLAAEVRVGDIVFADYPVSVFQSARTADFDGLIGADVFQHYLVGIDFLNTDLSLDARSNDQQAASDEPQDPIAPLPGFTQTYRLGDHLNVFTSANDGPPELFLIDSGSSSNLIDTEFARASTSVYRDDRTVIKGVQGKVDHASRALRITLLFAGFRQENTDLIAMSFDKMNDSRGVGIAGILGLPVLEHLKLTIDYRSGTVRFEKKQ
ncbi:MAG: aspartyl protease family protein [Bryobacteraceae bacterium]